MNCLVCGRLSRRPSRRVWSLKPCLDRYLGMTFETIDAKWMTWTMFFHCWWFVQYHFCKSIIKTYSTYIWFPSWKYKTRNMLRTSSLRWLNRCWWPSMAADVVENLQWWQILTNKNVTWNVTNISSMLTDLLGSRICWIMTLSFEHDFEHFSFSLILTYFPHL